MACGAYHSLVVLGEASKGFRRVNILILYSIIYIFVGGSG